MEEENERAALELTIKRHRRLFRHLFDKYANSGYTRKVAVFDALLAKAQKITLAEFRKMLNDHEIIRVGREELTALFRLVGIRLGGGDPQSLGFDGFVECFTQLAIRMQGRVPLGEAVRGLISQFAAAAAKKGVNTVIYTDPEVAALSTDDQRLVKELEKMLEKAPNYPLPEGFRKVQERDIRYVHSIGEGCHAIKQSVQIAAELLDTVLSQALGVHFLESRAHLTHITRVYPEPLKASASVSMLKPQPSVASSLGKPGRRLGKLEPVPRVSVETKLAVSRLPKEMQIIGIEVGAVVEEIIKAVEDGRTAIAEKGVNRALRERREQEENAAREEREKELKRRQRQRLLKQRIETKKAALPKADAKGEETKKSAGKEERERELEDVKRRIEERTQKRKEERLRTEQERKAKVREERSRRQKELEPFVQRKKEEFVPALSQQNRTN